MQILGCLVFTLTATFGVQLWGFEVEKIIDSSMLVVLHYPYNSGRKVILVTLMFSKFIRMYYQY